MTSDGDNIKYNIYQTLSLHLIIQNKEGLKVILLALKEKEGWIVKERADPAGGQSRPDQANSGSLQRGVHQASLLTLLLLTLLLDVWSLQTIWLTWSRNNPPPDTLPHTYEPLQKTSIKLFILFYLTNIFLLLFIKDYIFH